MLDKRMLIALSFFIAAWSMFTFENQKAMQMRSERLANLAAEEMTASPVGFEDHMDDENVLVDIVPSDSRRMVTSGGKQAPTQVPEKFTGTLSEVNTGCFADGECYIVVSGKHVTMLWGWTNEIVGSVRNAEGGIGELEKHIGGSINVYANKLSDGSYTLYGDVDYFVELAK